MTYALQTEPLPRVVRIFRLSAVDHCQRILDAFQQNRSLGAVVSAEHTDDDQIVVVDFWDTDEAAREVRSIVTSIDHGAWEIYRSPALVD